MSRQKDSKILVLKETSWILNSLFLALVYPHLHVQDICYKFSIILEASKMCYTRFILLILYLSKKIPQAHNNHHIRTISIEQIHTKLLPNVLSIYFSIKEKQKT